VLLPPPPPITETAGDEQQQQQPMTMAMSMKHEFAGDAFDAADDDGDGDF
jgi:hypothetical protein